MLAPLWVTQSFIYLCVMHCPIPLAFTPASTRKQTAYWSARLSFIRCFGLCDQECPAVASFERAGAPRSGRLDLSNKHFGARTVFRVTPIKNAHIRLLILKAATFCLSVLPSTKTKPAATMNRAGF